MGIAAAIGGAAALASTASSISNLVGGSGGGSSGGYSSGSSPPAAYIPTAQPWADQSYQNLTNPMISSATSIPSSVVPQLQNYTNQITGNPYAAQMQAGANQASAYGSGPLAQMQMQGAGSLQGLGQGAAPYASQILQTGFDPQNALYQRTAQQVQDQANAINSMYGLGSSPAGAGVADQAMSNFNIDWQNQALQRQATAAQGFGSLQNAVGQDYTGASALGGQAVNTLSTAGALPYQTALTAPQNSISALNNLSTGANTAYGLDQNTLNALAAYLKLGQSATSVGQAGAAQNFGNNQALGAGLSNAIGSLGALGNIGGNLFGPAPYTGSSYGGTYSYDSGGLFSPGAGYMYSSPNYTGGLASASGDYNY